MPRASAEAVREVAELLTIRMRQMGSESAGGERRHDSWFKLFKHMDDDGSGKVAYVEFEGLVRHELQLTPKELPEAALKAVWVALDSDGSGHISVGEFGAFMRKGEPHKGKAGGNWLEARAQRRAAQAAKARHTNLLRKRWRLEEVQRQQVQMQTRVKQACCGTLNVASSLAPSLTLSLALALPLALTLGLNSVPNPIPKPGPSPYP